MGSGNELKFAVLGHPVGHSLSPAMHAANFAALGLKAAYGAMDVPPEELPTVVRWLVTEGYRGFNCTIPHKEAVCALVDRLDASAVSCGAANTVAIAADGMLTGYNTDGIGFLLALDERGQSPAGRDVWLLGAGGAARAIAQACLAGCAARGIGGCARLTLVNRTPARAEALRAVLAAQAAQPIEVVPWGNVRPGPSALVVNATSVGLKPDDPSVLPCACFRAGQVFCDIIPVARETTSVKAARAAGAETVGGLGMLVHQGAEAFRIWTGLEPDVRSMQAACRQRILVA